MPKSLSTAISSLVNCTYAYIVSLGEKRGDWASRYRENPALFILISNGYTSKDLALADSEHLRPTYRADALSRWLTILHSYRLVILHFLLGPAFHTVCLH